VSIQKEIFKFSRDKKRRVSKKIQEGASLDFKDIDLPTNFLSGNCFVFCA
jgi:hypothetical protein